MNKMFGLNGIAGLLLLIIVLLSVAIGLGIQAWRTQKAQASNAYIIQTKEVKVNSAQNSQYYELIK
ncbi:DUF4006 domain-containing protein [Helicobacter cholecystus]|uniref:DUF4006 domain-containing protein n=1 Tax=Helicobacter cholecystus TaxID=45498 RepID=A0A3D8IXH0_9HELI|nr:DUF4006 family protein [Helicobacter cholecystus]RDU69979.1 DUF4006 domain-containing protein [Helicobacter cholecystus]VEJ24852.1 putative inner membrane protein [Helicobacter cholecystus]